MRKHGGTPSRRDKHVTPAAISPPGVARGRFVGGQQSGLAVCKPPPLFMRGASSCSSQGRRQGEPWGASPRPSAPTYLPQPSYNQMAAVAGCWLHSPANGFFCTVLGVLPMAGIKALAVHTSDFRPSRAVRYYRLTNQLLQGDL